jgi:hypothetical protein
VRAPGSVVLAHDSCAASRAISERSAVMRRSLHASSPVQLRLSTPGSRLPSGVLQCATLPRRRRSGNTVSLPIATAALLRIALSPGQGLRSCGRVASRPAERAPVLRRDRGGRGRRHDPR